jgi:hypothetical protein
MIGAAQADGMRSPGARQRMDQDQVKQGERDCDHPPKPTLETS